MSNTHRRLGSVIAAFVLLLGVAASAEAHESRPAERPLYAALGDSLAAGEGTAIPSVSGYVPRVHRRLRRTFSCGAGTSVGTQRRDVGCRRLRLINVARSATETLPGVTTGAVIDEQLPVVLPAIARRNGDDDPGNDVEVVTLDVGGNDLFGPVIAACLSGPSDDCTATIVSGLGQVAVNYEIILSALRDAAGDGTPIVVLTYYNPIPFCDLGAVPGAIELGELVLEGGGPLPVGLNDIIRASAAGHGADVAEGYGLLGGDDLVGGSDCLHPNEAGHRKLAAAVLEVLVD